MKSSGIIKELPHLSWSAELLGIGTAADKDRTGCDIRFVVTFQDLNHPDIVPLNSERVELAGDSGLNGIQRILDG